LFLQIESIKELLATEYILFIAIYVYIVFKFFKTGKIQVRVFQDHLQIQDGKKNYDINFADITKIESKINVTLHYGEKRHFLFDHHLERADYIIDAIVP